MNIKDFQFDGKIILSLWCETLNKDVNSPASFVGVSLCVYVCVCVCGFESPHGHIDTHIMSYAEIFSKDFSINMQDYSAIYLKR